jgi:uncharacterized protein (TIGR02466 family)
VIRQRTISNQQGILELQHNRRLPCLWTTNPMLGGLRISVLFPTLLGEVWRPDHVALNADLAAYIRDRERRDRDFSPFTAVNHGWQSGPDFFDAEAPAVQMLKHFINQQIEAFLREWGRVSFTAGTPATFRYRYSGWAVILRQGGFQYEHVHTKTDLIGIYYVEVPDAPAGVGTGNLTLVDPRAGRVATRAIWENAHYSVPPRPGMLLLFPSFVPHRVDRVQASGERISINFDIALEGVS